MKESKNTTVKNGKQIVRKESVIEITDREIELVQLLVNENSRVEIAKEWDLSPRTVETMVYKVMDKVGCKTAYGLIATFFRNGLIK